MAAALIYSSIVQRPPCFHDVRWSTPAPHRDLENNPAQIGFHFIGGSALRTIAEHVALRLTPVIAKTRAPAASANAARRCSRPPEPCTSTVLSGP